MRPTSWALRSDVGAYHRATSMTMDSSAIDVSATLIEVTEAHLDQCVLLHSGGRLTPVDAAKAK